MHDERDLEWASYAAQCIRNIFSGRISETSATNEDLTIIYFAAQGDEQVIWDSEDSPVKEGWRDTESGIREAVYFYGGEWGWMSSSELTAARQAYPRTAP